MSIESIMTALGYVIANWVGYGASFSTSSFQWRFPLAIQVLFALFVLIATPFLPGKHLFQSKLSLSEYTNYISSESPRWLIEQDNDDHAFALIKKLHFTGQNDDFVLREFQEMRDQIMVERKQTVRSYKEALSKPSWRRRVLLACGVWIGVSLSGITLLELNIIPLPSSFRIGLLHWLFLSLYRCLTQSYIGNYKEQSSYQTIQSIRQCL
jgi:hypothetical protein